MAYIEVAKTGDVAPGKLAGVTANGRKLILANVDGRFHAADRKCPHIGAPLSFGRLEGCNVVCPLHSAKFDLVTGEVTADPKLLFIAMKAKRPLNIYPVKVDGDAVLVDIGSPPRKIRGHPR